MKKNDSRLLIGGIITTLLILGYIGYGQLKTDVNVPQIEATWPHGVGICADTSVDQRAFVNSVSLVQDHLEIVWSQFGKCDHRAAIHLKVSVADVDRISPPTGGFEDGYQAAHEAYELEHIGNVITNCTVYLVDPKDVKTIVHGTIHCMGYEHAINAPIGHVMNGMYDRIGLKDFRGIP